MDNGYILIHRKLLEWEWYSNANDTRLFIHCLLKANWKNGRFMGFDIPRGSFVTSITKLVEETGLTIQQIKTSIKHLKLTNEITYQTNHQFSIITINKYNDYQFDNKPINQRLTNEQPTINNNIIKEIKEINKETISKDIVKKNFLKPTIDEIADYCLERNNQVDPERFFNFYESKNWYVGKNKMKDWKAAVRTWEQRNKEENKTPSWLGKEIKERKLTDEEQKQLEELIRGN